MLSIVTEFLEGILLDHGILASLVTGGIGLVATLFITKTVQNTHLEFQNSLKKEAGMLDARISKIEEKLDHAKESSAMTAMEAMTTTLQGGQKGLREIVGTRVMAEGLEG